MLWMWMVTLQNSINKIYNTTNEKLNELVKNNNF